MSRVGLGVRLARVQEAIRTQHPFGYALHNLNADMRAKYDRWLNACDKAAGARGEAGARYAALSQGVSFGPPMPSDLAAILGRGSKTRHDITRDMTVDEAARVYESMLQEGKSK